MSRSPKLSLASAPTAPIYVTRPSLLVPLQWLTHSDVTVANYSHTPHNVSVNDRPHIRRSFHTILILYLKPNDLYIGRTARLTSRRCILYIYSTNMRTEYFKHAAHSLCFFPLQNVVYFIMLPCLVPVLFAFYIQGVLKCKCKIPATKGYNYHSVTIAYSIQYNNMLCRFLA